MHAEHGHIGSVRAKRAMPLPLPILINVQHFTPESANAYERGGCGRGRTRSGRRLPAPSRCAAARQRGPPRGIEIDIETEVGPHWPRPRVGERVAGWQAEWAGLWAGLA